MSVFVDTSALITILDGAEKNHAHADVVWRDLLARCEDMVSTNYVLVETCAVAQRRLGVEAIRSLEERAVPLLRIVWIDEDMHRVAIQSLLTAARRHLSLVDCTSFGVMRRLGIRQVFAYDEHFSEQGFECL